MGHPRTAVPVADDLGHPVDLAGPPTRIVSLVPSLTEALALSVPDRLVGATEWCTRPEGLAVARVRGTKNPDHAAIAGLRPDLVVANQEENRRVDVERLRAAGTAVWVTRVESVDGALASLGRLLVEGVGVTTPTWLEDARATWGRPPRLPPLRVVVPVWRDPWMVVGPSTYAGDVVARLGLVMAPDAGPGRYPKVEPERLRALRPDLVLLPDEPYAFTADDGPEAFPGIPTVLVPGRSLTWYGPAMVAARRELEDLVAPVTGASGTGWDITLRGRLQ